ncbi:MAG: flavodoxin family protein [Anaerovoracaceae bacterium]|jgi:multimeric flavodoxin WrbA
MKITMINGQDHKGSTYHIGRMLADRLSGEVTEFFLPRDFGEYCTGCNQCFMKDEKLCPHYEKLQPITAAMDEADLLLFTTPVYVYHCTGQMKSFLDHYGYRWMVHRPEESMFSKQAVIISTAAGKGTKSTNKDIADSMFFWGVARTYTYGFNVRAVRYSEVTEERKARIASDVERLARKIERDAGHVRPGFKTRSFFRLVRKIRRHGWQEADLRYWQEKGWDKDRYPWDSKK